MSKFGDDPTMWGVGNVLEDLKKFCFSKPLEVYIPKKIVKVPQQKSKKAKELFSKPRDPHATPCLLTIAPLSDERYDHILKLVDSPKLNLNDAYSSKERTIPENFPSLTVNTSSMYQVASNLWKVNSFDSNHLREYCNSSAPTAFANCFMICKDCRWLDQRPFLSSNNNRFNSVPEQKIAMKRKNKTRDFWKVSAAPRPVAPLPITSVAGCHHVYGSSTDVCPCSLCLMTRQVKLDMTSSAMASQSVSNNLFEVATNSYQNDLRQFKSRSKRKQTDVLLGLSPSPKKFIVPNQTFSSQIPVSAPFSNRRSFGHQNHVTNFAIQSHLQATSSSPYKSSDFMTTPTFDCYSGLNSMKRVGSTNTISLNGFDHLISAQIANVIR